MATIASLVVKISADIAEMVTNTDRAAASLEKVGGAAESMESLLVGVGKSIAGAFTVEKVVEFAGDILETAGNIKQLSDQTGIATKDLQTLQYASVGSGVGIEQLANSISALSTRLARGDNNAVEAVQKLGLNFEALRRQNPHEIFLQIVKAIGGLPDQLDAALVASDLFGDRLGRSILKLAHEDLPELEKQAVNTGAVMDDSLIKGADAFNAAWDHAVMSVKASLFNLLDVVPKAMPQPGTVSLSGETSAPKITGEEAMRRMGQSAQVLAEGTTVWLSNIIQGEDVSEKIAGWWEDIAREHEAAARKAEALAAAEKRVHDEALETSLEMSSVADKLEKAFDEIADTEAIEAFKQEIASIALTFDDVSTKIEADAKLMGEEIADALSMAKVAIPPTLGEDMFKGLGASILHAVEGGGNVLQSIGSSFGLGFTQHTFGSTAFKSLITSKFGSALGGMFNNILPGIGALAGPLLSKLGDLFGGIFGGPSKQEKAGRSATDQFTQSLQSALTWTQQLEVHQAIAAGGSEKWAVQMIAVRDAYLAAGKTSDEAEAAVARLWEAEKQGGTAAQQVIDDIIIATGNLGKNLDAATAAIKKDADTLQQLTDNFLGTEQLHQADLLVKAIENIGGATHLTADEMANVHRQVQAAIDKYHALGIEAPQALMDLEMATRGATDSLQDMIDKAEQAIRVTNEATGGVKGPGGVKPITQADIEDFLRRNPDDNNAERIKRAFGNITDPDLLAGIPGFASGSNGLRNFGTGTLAILHGSEEVRTAGQVNAEGSLLVEIKGLRSDLKNLPIIFSDQLKLTVRAS